jgi:hypothetical protein
MLEDCKCFRGPAVSWAMLSSLKSFTLRKLIIILKVTESRVFFRRVCVCVFVFVFVLYPRTDTLRITYMNVVSREAIHSRLLLSF